MTNQTGPKTIAGKRRSSRNAWKHGIASPSPILPGGIESETEWRRHVQGTLDSLAPDGHLETVLAERIALLLWRIKRVERYDSETILISLANAPRETMYNKDLRAMLFNKRVVDPITVDDIDDAIGKRLIPPQWAMDRIQRYESHLHRLFLQTLHELEAIQARRKGEPVNLARVDITASPIGGIA